MDEIHKNLMPRKIQTIWHQLNYRQQTINMVEVIVVLELLLSSIHKLQQSWYVR